VFSWSEVHLSEVTSYKIHTLEDLILNQGRFYPSNFLVKSLISIFCFVLSQNIKVNNKYINHILL
jgi:hypothetical protein